MAEIDTDSLRSLLEERRDGVHVPEPKPTKPKKKSTRKKASMDPPDWSAVKWPMETITFLSVDQSLANCGYALMRTGFGLVPDVIKCSTIHVDIGRKGTGFRESMEKGDLLYGAFRAVLLDLGIEGFRIEAIVHEMPAVKGFMAASSEMAACRVRDAACSEGFRGLLGMVQAQHAKKLVCGDGNGDKKKVHEQMPLAYAGYEERGPGWDGTKFRTDVDQRDAIMNGLAAVMDGTVHDVAGRGPR